MARRNRLLALVLFAAAANGAHADVLDSATERALSLFSNAPSLVIPRSDWVIGSERVRQDRLVVYYLMSSESAKVTFSVYINGAKVCESAERCLELSLTNPNYNDARDLGRTDVGPFKAAHFHIDKPLGVPLQQTHVLASGVMNGHWFDIHLSSAGKERPHLAPLLEILRTFSIR